MKAYNLLADISCACAQSYTYDPAGSDTHVSIKVNGHNKHQTMIGGGCSGAFGIACDQFGAAGLSPTNQQEVTKTLFDENIGALSIVRNLIQSTKQALKYNPDLFVYADAWSAPGCMKSNKNESDGGLICGVRGSNCSADWRQAYADYLIQLVRFYKEKENVTISMLGAYNEPDFNPGYYSSMLSDGYQAKDFLEVLYPTVKKAFPELKVACCDATGARQLRDILYQLNRIGGGNLYDEAQEFNTLGQPNLETEWADGTGAWNANWDVTGQLAEGFQWAINMYNAFTRSSTSGYTHWWCTQNTTGDNALIRLSANSYTVSARLCGFAGYFRFARPGSVRVDASSEAEDIYVSSFVNANGTVAVPVVNAAHFAQRVRVESRGLGRLSRGSAYLTDNAHNVSLAGRFEITGGGGGEESEDFLS
ncbi:hypothetical protein Q7P35_012130 [Cladosporium inversicolor]